MKSFAPALKALALATVLAASPALAISIAAPGDGTTVGEARIVVSGRAGGDTLKVGLNSKPLPEVQIRDGFFSFPVTLSAGANSLVLRSASGDALLSIGFDAGAGTYLFHPGYAEGECGECHEKSIGRIEAASHSGLCHNCHDSMDKAAFLHGPVAAGQCGFCHDPHGSSEKAFLTRGGPDLCGACHDQSGSKKHMSESAGKACTECHNPHGSEEKFFLY